FPREIFLTSYAWRFGQKKTPPVSTTTAPEPPKEKDKDAETPHSGCLVSRGDRGVSRAEAAGDAEKTRRWPGPVTAAFSANSAISALNTLRSLREIGFETSSTLSAALTLSGSLLPRTRCDLREAARCALPQDVHP